VPEAWRFPARNRIIAALSDVLLVVEAHGASGSRHTVDAALARDVTVLAVPGPIRSAASLGVNRLLREGCAPACDLDDVLIALQLSGGRRDPAADRRPPPSRSDAAVLAAVDWVPTSVETILQRTSLSPIHASTALAHLEVAGWIRSSGGWWERIAAR
jgi:DNA processing protein